MTALKAQTVTKNINIIGAGASGLYTCFKLLQLNKLSPPEDKVKLNINIWDKLPIPFGLVRNGVAPDHPEIKNCIDTFKEIFTDRALYGDNSVKFVGNYNITKMEEYQELMKKSDVLYLANGCEQSRDYNLENKTEANTLKARDLVNWYNNYPESKDTPKPVWKTEDYWSKIKNINIVGNGNVAFDLCRLLSMCKYDKEAINKSDINADFVDIIHKAPLKKINIIGRRDFESARFGSKEFRELWGLSKYGVTGYINPKYLSVSEAKPSRALAKKIQLTNKNSTEIENGNMKWELKFLQSPFKIENKKLLAKENVMDANNSSKPLQTDKIIEADNDLVILSIGTENPNMKELQQLMASNPQKITSVGWLRNKGFGTIASTMLDTFAVVDKDYKNMDTVSNKNSNELNDFEFLKGNERKLTSWSDYEKIEQYEREVKNGKKCDTVEEMLSVVNE